MQVSYLFFPAYLLCTLQSVICQQVQQRHRQSQQNVPTVPDTGFGGMFDSLFGPTTSPFTDLFGGFGMGLGGGRGGGGGGGVGMGNPMMNMFQFMSADVDYADQISAQNDARLARQEEQQARRAESGRAAGETPSGRRRGQQRHPESPRRRNWSPRENQQTRFSSNQYPMDPHGEQWQSPASGDPSADKLNSRRPHARDPFADNLYPQRSRTRDSFGESSYPRNTQARESFGEILYPRTTKARDRFAEQTHMPRPTQATTEQTEQQAEPTSQRSKWTFRLETTKQPDITTVSKRSIDAAKQQNENKNRLAQFLSGSNGQNFKDSAVTAARNYDFPVPKIRNHLQRPRTDRRRPLRKSTMDPDLMSDMMDMAGDFGMAAMFMNNMSKRGRPCDFSSLQTLMEYMLTGRMCGNSAHGVRFGLGRK